MYGWPKAFPKQNPFKHVHEAKERLRWGVCERHGMVLLCGLVPSQIFSSKWLTLGFVKRWCICGLSSLLVHSFKPKDDLHMVTFLFASCMFPYLILHAFNWQATLRNQPDKRYFFSVNVCLCEYVCAWRRQARSKVTNHTYKYLNFYIKYCSSIFKHFQTMSAICHFRYLANALIQNVLH